MVECACTICNSGSGSTSNLDVRLTFHFEELIDDINNYAWVEGEVLGDENQHSHHVLVEIAEEGNLERVLRIISLVHAQVVELLYPFTKLDAVAGENVCDYLWAPDCYVIHMSVPSTFSRTTLHYLSRLIHELIVYRVLAHWLSIANPDAAKKWEEKADAVEEKIEEAKNRRGKAFTRPLSPW